MNTFYVFVYVTVSLFKKFFGVQKSLIPAAIAMESAERRAMADELGRHHLVTVHSTEPSPCAQELTDAVASENTTAGVENNLYENATNTPRNLGSTRAKNQAAAARAFVFDMLRDAPVPVAIINQAAEKAGFTLSQLRRAADKVGVVRTKLPGMRTGWSWSLPTVNESDNDNLASPNPICGCSEVEVA